MPNSDGTYHTGGFRAQRRFTDPTSGYAGEPPQQRPPAPPVAERTAPPRPPESPVEPAPEPPRETAPEPERDDADPSAVREPSSAGATFGADPGLFTHGRHAGPMPPEWSGTTAPTASAVPPVLAEPAVHAEPTVRPQPALLPEPADPSASSRELSTAALLRQSPPPPTGGWRRWLYLASFKTINVGESTKSTHHRDLVAQVNRPLQGCYRIALLSLKGGVGKTTITATLGGTFASIRGDRVIAVDANPDSGTLSQKVPLETSATVRHLLRDAEGIERYSDIRSYTSQGPSRLEVLASESDPAVSEAFSADDYNRTLSILERFYSLVLTDCGTGLMHSAMSAVLDKADVLVVISSGSVDGARSASATLDWLDAHGHQEMVRNAIAVVNAVRPRSGKVDMNKVVDHFARRTRAVRLVPFDPHLEEGAEIDLDRLKPATRAALLDLAAVVADGFSDPGRR